jgi:hypothetical protein
MTLPIRFARSVFALAAFVVTLVPLAAQAQVDSLLPQPQAASYPGWSMQYDASYFTVLSATAGTRGAVTCTDSTIMGNVGSSGARPAVVKTRCSISGNITAPVAPMVLAEFNSEFNGLANKKCQKELAGTLAGVTLAPGVYCFPAAASVTGTLTLDGPATGVWVIKVNGSLTGKSFSMVMAGEAKPCNVGQCDNDDHVERQGQFLFGRGDHPHRWVLRRSRVRQASGHDDGHRRDWLCAIKAVRVVKAKSCIPRIWRSPVRACTGLGVGKGKHSPFSTTCWTIDQVRKQVEGRSPLRSDDICHLSSLRPPVPDSRRLERRSA